MLLLNLLMILLGCAIAALRWRWGLLAAIAVGLMQDPMRKLVPGTPGYLTMTFLPVWLLAVGLALASRESTVRAFFNQFPRAARWFIAFGAYLLLPAAISASYGRNSWQITLLGAFMAGAVFLSVVVGWRVAKDAADVSRVVLFYALGVALLLVGGPMEYFGWADRTPLIGSQALGHIWVTHRTGEAVYMFAGLFRSPDIMGWHAAMLMMVSGLMASRVRGRWRWFWTALSIWGLLSMWLCGRRKMISMVPIFWGCLLLLHYRLRGMRRAVSVLGVLMVILGMGWYSLTNTYKTRALDTFYLTVLDEWSDQVRVHGVYSILGTVRQAGFWGYGLGMSQQGLHHINAERPNAWQESGPSKLVAELGVPGSLLFLGLGGVLLRTIFAVVCSHARSPDFHWYAGLLALLLANLASAVVSAQVYGDPFIALLLALLAGLALSGAATGRAREARA